MPVNLISYLSRYTSIIFSSLPFSFRIPSCIRSINLTTYTIILEILLRKKNLGGRERETAREYEEKGSTEKEMNQIMITNDHCVGFVFSLSLGMSEVYGESERERERKRQPMQTVSSLPFSHRNKVVDFFLLRTLYHFFSPEPFVRICRKKNSPTDSPLITAINRAYDSYFENNTCICTSFPISYSFGFFSSLSTSNQKPGKERERKKPEYLFTTLTNTNTYRHILM